MERAYRWTRRATAAAAVALLGLLTLAGCGQVSLMNLLDSEDPGEFTVQPGTASLVEGSSVDILPQGGFRPYSLALIGEGELVDGLYTAPTGVGVGGETVTIEATDRFGDTALSTLRISARLRLTEFGSPVEPVTAVELLESEDFWFVALGGEGPYDYYLDDQPKQLDTWMGWVFPASAAGVYQVEAEDSQGTRAGATVTVLAAGQVAISPSAAAVVVGGSVQFQALNVSGSQLFSVDAPGTGTFDDPAANPATYRAPAGETIETVRLTDGAAEVTATVYVISADPGPLTISPASLGFLGYGEQVLFTASGGVPPYAFRVEGDDVLGTLQEVPPNKARYTAPLQNAVNWLYLTDALGDWMRLKLQTNDR